MVFSLSSCATVDEFFYGFSKGKIDDFNRIIAVANEKWERWYWLPTHRESFTLDGKSEYTLDITYAEDTYVPDIDGYRVEKYKILTDCFISIIILLMNYEQIHLI